MTTTAKLNPTLRFFTCSCIIILTIFAITTIALYAETRKIADRYPTDKTTPWRGPDDDTMNGDDTYYWPNSILYGADRLVLAAGIISLISALFGLLSCFVSGSEIVCSLLGLVSLGTSMGALIHSMDWHSKYGKVSWYGAEIDIYRQYMSTFTLEKWTCELKDFLVWNYEARDYAKMCKNSKAFRFLTIPLFLLGILLLVMMYLLYADRKKQERETVEEENVEMGPPGAPPKYTKSEGTEVV